MASLGQLRCACSVDRSVPGYRSSPAHRGCVLARQAGRFPNGRALVETLQDAAGDHSSTGCDHFRARLCSHLRLLLAWRSYRLGRGDRQGAFRLAVFVFAVLMLQWLCTANHVPTLAEFGGFLVAVSGALLGAGFFWMVYMALEPYVRRRWPQSMIAWSRLLGGAVRDPVVGGNLLIGAAFGVATAAVFLVHNLVLDVDRSMAGTLDLKAVLDVRHMTSLFLGTLLDYIGTALGCFFFSSCFECFCATNGLRRPASRSCSRLSVVSTR